MRTLLSRFRNWIIGAVILVVAGGGLWLYQARNGNEIEYVVQTVERGTLDQSVDVTGTLEASETIDLSFRVTGMVAEVNVHIGDRVEEGEIIARLENSDEVARVREAEASLSEARASLNLELADAKDEDIAIEVANLEEAKVNHRKSLVNLENAKENLDNTEKSVAQDKALATIDLGNAELALKKIERQVANQTTQDDTSVQNALLAYRSAVSRFLNSVATVMDMTDIIFGSTGAVTPAIQQSDISGEDGVVYTKLRTSFFANKNVITDIQNAFDDVGPTPTIGEMVNIQLEMDALVKDLTSMVTLLGDLLERVGGVPELPFSQYDSITTSFNTAIREYNNEKALFDDAVLEQAENLDVDPLDVETAQLELEKARERLSQVEVEGDIEIADARNEVDLRQAEVDVQQSLIDKAQAALDLLLADPREVDLGPFRARVQQAEARLLSAQTALEKTLIKAPIAGLITMREVDFGEQVTAGSASGTQVAFQMIDDHEFHIEVNVPETQINKITEDSEVSITFDSIGTEETFDGKIVSIEPGATEIDDIIYYKVDVALTEADGRMKSGMTADVLIHAEPKSDALIVPEIAVFKEDGKKWVYVPTDDRRPRDQVLVRTGVRGTGGVIEIVSGLEEGQQILVPKQ